MANEPMSLVHQDADVRVELRDHLQMEIHAEVVQRKCLGMGCYYETSVKNCAMHGKIMPRCTGVVPGAVGHHADRRHGGQLGPNLQFRLGLDRSSMMSLL